VVTVGFAQFAPVRGNVGQNIITLKKLLSGVQVDLLVLPELSNSGYLYASPEDLAPFTEDGDGSGPFLSAIHEMAVGIGGMIVTGFAEKDEFGLYNSAAAVAPTGEVEIYRKIHLFAGEKDLFLPGDSGFRVLTFRAIRIGIMICFDWFFPESARSLALKGAQVIAHPANLVLPYCQQAMVTRSLENAVYSITANRYGEEQLDSQQLRFTGGSQVLDPKGRLLAQASVEGNCVVVCEIDPVLADDKKVTPRNDLFLDRRPDLYAS
jgi:predicted amidohydrolase